MAATMRRSEVLKWLEAHGGQSSDKDAYKVDYIEKHNPAYDVIGARDKGVPEKITVKQVTWKAKDGQTITVIDPETAPPPAETNIALPNAPGQPVPDYQGPYSPEAYDPVYQQPEENVGSKETTPDRTPQHTAETEADSARMLQEKQKNLQDPNSGRWETDAERAKREKEEAATARQREIDAGKLAVEQRQVGVSEGSLAETIRANRAKEAEANQPKPISTPSEEAANIAIFNPVTGRVESQPNPIYNEAKVQAQQKKDELTLAIQMNKLSADQAAAEYQRWFQTNIELPFKQADEARSRASAQNQALEAEERRRQFAANFGLQKSELGQRAAQTAIQAEESLLPYRAGPDEAADMSAAINSLAAGGKPSGPSAAAGINFKASDFQFAAPNFKKIAADATKQALSGLTDYRPSDQQFAVPDYSGITIPNSDVIAGAPPVGGSNQIDVNAIFQSMTGGKYGPFPGSQQ